MNHMIAPSIAVLAIGLLAASVNSAFGQTYSYRTVAKTGDAAPVLGGVFIGFGQPYLNTSGQVAFTATRSGELATSGMWMTPLGASSPSELIMAADMAVPGAPGGVTFGAVEAPYSHPLLNDAGNVGFAAALNGLSDGNFGVFRMIDGQLSAVAIPGQIAPGTANQQWFTEIGNLVTFSESDRLAFKAKLAGPGVSAANDEGVFTHWFGGLSLVHREGASVPGMPGVTFGQVLSPAIQIGEDGRLAFNPGLHTAQEYVISYWTGWPAAFSMVTMGTNLSPANLPYVAFTLVDFWGLSITQDGMVFAHQVESNNNNYFGLWRYDGKTIETVVYESSLGPLGFYENVAAWHAAADGTTVFNANFTGFGLPTSTDSALIRKRPGEAAEVVVRENDPAPGYWDGVVFDEITGGIFEALDDTGRIYFSAPVRGNAIDEGNDHGAWMIDADGVMRLVIREGQWLTLDDGVQRQVASFGINSGISLHAGRRPSVNNHGNVAIRVSFTDGTSAIVVAALTASCLGDVNQDDMVDVNDLLLVIGAWGSCGSCAVCSEDIDKDCVVAVEDLLTVIGHWGPCD